MAARASMRHEVQFNDGQLTSHAVQFRTAVRPDPGPLSVAVIGRGAVVEGLYLSALRKVEARGLATITTLVDPNVERAAKLTHHFGRARSFASVDDALNDRVPDLVIVASPAGHHAASAIAALDAGSAVLCE